MRKKHKDIQFIVKKNEILINILQEICFSLICMP